MTAERVRTGIPGLDQILSGGLPANALYLLKGAPGTGKTTLGLQYLMEGARRGEACLYLGLSETCEQLAAIARSYGRTLDGIEVHEMRLRGGAGEPRSAYTVFRPSEVELDEISREISEQVDRVRPTRLVLDSLSEIRLISDEPFRYRRELLVLSDQIAAHKCTGWLLDIEIPGNEALVADTLVSGVIQLQQFCPAYGGERRRLRVSKLRASRTMGGYHDFVILDDGIEVYPRLVAASHRSAHSSAEVSSGIGELDALLGGGLDRGTSTLLLGPGGAGKSTMATQFVATAAARGERSLMFCFDESPTNVVIRARGLGIPLAEHVEAGKVEIIAVDPAEFTPGELAHRVRAAVERGARMVVLDSLNGYLDAMPEERFLSAHLHELLAYLSEKGVATLLTIAQHGFFGKAKAPVNISYVADTVLLFRYFEVAGEVRQAVSVLKKRTGHHERTLRELQIGPSGVHLGPPLSMLAGVLTRNPVYAGDALPGVARDPAE